MSAGTTPRVGLVADLREERWPSMDLVADMIAAHVPCAAPGVTMETLRAPFRRRMATNGAAPGSFDRIVNRFFDYPRWLRTQRDAFDVFHVVDHSYAHLLHVLPPGRVVVTCHDVDAFAPFIGPHSASRLPRWLARRVLSGLRRARVVVCVSEATRDELVRHHILDPGRLRVVPNGVDPHCAGAPDREADAEADALLGTGETLDVLHVGSTIPRKRIDVLLEVIAELARAWPDVRLVRVGGPLTGSQREQARTLGVTGRLIELPFMDRRVLAAVYRRAALVLLPSEREGFGLPLVEALAAGTPVVASDIPALREVGGSAATYCPVADVRAWTEAVSVLLREQAADTPAWDRRVAAGRAHARRWSWPAVARELGALYTEVAS